MENDDVNMEKQPFVRYSLEEDDNKKFETISIKINKDERLRLDEAKRLLQQPKDGTALKQVFEIGLAFVIQDQKTKLLIDTIFNNKRRNQRLGINDFE